MQPRRMLFAAVVIVAAATAATWVVSQPPRRFGAAPVDVASVENAASAAGEPHAAQPRRGAGTIGARAGSLGAVAAPGEYRSRASQRGDAGAGQRLPRAPRPSPLPGVASDSTAAQPESADAPGSLAWSGQGVEVIAPPTPGRDPRDGERVRESDPPPDPTTIASGFPPAQPTPAPPVTPPRATPPDSPSNGTPDPPSSRAPDAGDGSGNDSGGHADGPGSETPVPNQGPLSEAEIARRVPDSLPPPIQAVEANRIRTNSGIAASFTN